MPSRPHIAQTPYASAYHAPVLVREVVDLLVTEPDGVYVDGTLGGGGHTAALLDVLGPNARVVGIDRDPEALATASARLDDPRFVPVRGNFADLDALLAEALPGTEAVHGILLDLGVSSHQIDEASRGFAFGADGPLDMRMNPETVLSAADLVNTMPDDELVALLRTYGEEPRAPRIVRAIAAARPLTTTAALADAVRSAVPYKEEVKSLSRVFQALRIAVNDELGALERALIAGLKSLRVGGRMAVIAYHSLEDRRVKHFFRYGNFENEPVRDFYGNLLTPWETVTRKTV